MLKITQIKVVHMLCLLCTFLCVVSSNNAFGNPDARINVDTTHQPVPLPKLFDTSVTLDEDEVADEPPTIPKTTLKKLPELNSLDERIDRLTRGVQTTMRPEYDHYGYEIRRYMASSGDMKIYEDRDFIEKQIKNVRKASIIADYWKKYLEQELKDIEGIIEKGEGVSFVNRTEFKQGKITIRTFLISLRGWIDANERFLTQLYENLDLLDLYYPEVLISDNKIRVDFYNKLLLRQTKVNEIKAYQPFSMMVY